MSDKKSDLFAARLRRLRHIDGLTQEQLAKKLNMSRSCIANYERGKRYPDRQNLWIFAKYFRVSYQYMAGEITAEEAANTLSGFTEKADRIMTNDRLDISELSLVRRTSIRDYLEYLKNCNGT